MHKQIKKEITFSFLITIFYFISWIIIKYIPDEYNGIFKIPLWFECGCIYLPIVFNILCILIIKFIFV